MRYVLCAAALLLPSVAWAERINIESVAAFRRAADDTLRVNVELSAPMNLGLDTLQVWLRQHGQHGEGTTKAMSMVFGVPVRAGTGSFDPTTGMVPVTNSLTRFIPGGSETLDRVMFDHPASFDRQSLSLVFDRTATGFALGDWYIAVQAISDEGAWISNDGGPAHAPEPSSVALAGIGVVAFGVHWLLRLPRSRKGRRERHVGRKAKGCAA